MKPSVPMRNETKKSFYPSFDVDFCVPAVEVYLTHVVVDSQVMVVVMTMTMVMTTMMTMMMTDQIIPLF